MADFGKWLAVVTVDWLGRHIISGWPVNPLRYSQPGLKLVH